MSLKPYYYFLLLSFFLVTLVSCGGGGGGKSTDKKGSPTEDDDYLWTNPGDCKFKPVSNDECFYLLPDIPNGEHFTGYYRESLEKDTKGVTVGRGVWGCRNGSWFEIEAPLCLTCNPGRSLQHCESELNRLIETTD